MELIDSDLSLVRDYVGLEAPTDGELYELAESVEHWQEVALRVLRRRLADANSGSAVTSFGLSGVLNVGVQHSDVKILRSQIQDLENQLAEISGALTGGVTVARLVRPDRAR